ncbi:MAG: hypothetical protein GWP47_02880 [Actinobacteria bacterium]|nr:hypothetical protein [Actinomycetota bacterium]
MATKRPWKATTGRSSRWRLASVAVLLSLFAFGIAAAPANSAIPAVGEVVVAGQDFELGGGFAASVSEASYAGWSDVATNPAGEMFFVYDTWEQDGVVNTYGISGRIVGPNGEIGAPFIVDVECSAKTEFGHEPASVTWNSTNEEWLVVMSLEGNTDPGTCPFEGISNNGILGQVVARDGTLRGEPFSISETINGVASDGLNNFDDIEHVHARWSPVAAAYLVTWKAAAMTDDVYVHQRVWATAIDADGMSLADGLVDDVSGDAGSDDGVSLAYSETADVFITVFTVDANSRLPGARLIELVRSESGVSINFTTDSFDLHGLNTDGDGNRAGNGAPTVGWDSLRDEFGVRWRAEDLDGNPKQQLFNVVGVDGSYSDTGIVKLLSPEGFQNGGRAGVAYDDVADEWVLVLTTAGTNELSMARIDAAARFDVTPTVHPTESTSAARPNLAYLGDGCLVYTWWEFGLSWDATEDPEAVWAHIECFFTPTGSVAFDANPGTGGPEAITSDGGSSVTIPQTLPSLDGYTFIEWNTAVDGSGDSYNGDDAYTLPDTGTATLYAQWQQVGCDSTDVLGSTVFTDVTPGRYYDESIGWMHTDGITTGTTLTTFDPDRPATRAEVITFLWRDEGSPSSTLGSSIFTDVTPGRYSDQAIGWASETGTTTGTTLTTFDPDRPATRGEVAIFFGRLNGCE